MAIITGSVWDFLGTGMSGKAPILVLTPSGPAVSASQAVIFAADPIEIVPDAGGYFTEDVQPTDDLLPEGWYAISIKRLDAGNNYIRVDYPDWRLYVPTAGGAINNLLNIPWNPVLAWSGPDAPIGPAVANTLWLDTDTGTLSIWSN